jgi:septal ring factor EnvC (AmiA/AmiB activator)
LRRKENKSRRDIEDYMEEVRKYKDQVKTLQTDMNSLNTVQSQSFYERKKVMDEIIKLEDALSNKDF